MMDTIDQDIKELTEKALKGDLNALQILRERGLLKTKSNEHAQKTTQFFPMSHAQKRLWILSQIYDGNIAYNMPAAFYFEGVIDQQRTEQTLNLLVQRHEILRTTFTLNQHREPIQCIHPDMDIHLEYMDFSTDIDAETKAKECIQVHSQYAFNLEKGPLLCAFLICLKHDPITLQARYLFFVNMHHIISDGWSIRVLFHEFHHIYSALSKGLPNPLIPLSIQYRHYTEWQNHMLLQEKMKDHQAFWLKQYHGDIPVLRFPLDFSRPNLQTFHGDIVSIDVPSEWTKLILAFCSNQRVTLFMASLTAFYVLLYRYTDQTDLIIGSPVSGRDHMDFENQIGFYVNSIPLRMKIDSSHSFHKLLQSTASMVLETFEHQSYPFDKLVDELSMKRDLSRSPVFDIMLVVEQNDLAFPEIDGLRFIRIEPIHYFSKFDLSLYIQQDTQGLRFAMEYNTDLFKKERMIRMLSHFFELIKHGITMPNTSIADINILTDSEKTCLLETFQVRAPHYIIPKTISELFEDQVQKTPDEPAVLFENQVITYDQLNQQANGIAWYLKNSLHIQPEDRIGVIMDRGIGLILGLISIFKSGGVYVPVDPEYPEQRIKHILMDSGCRFVLTESKYQELLHDLIPEITSISLSDIRSSENTVNPQQSANPRNLAYIIYTSGSTGLPKGVMLEHQGFVNMILSQRDRLDIHSNDRVLQFASCSFDGSLYEIWIALLSGACLVCIPQQRFRDPEWIIRSIKHKGITIAALPPTLIQQIGFNQLKELRILMTAGENAISDKGKFVDNEHQYWNLYGPTEISVTATSFCIPENLKADNSPIPIGVPVANMDILILSLNGNGLQPIGISGEICISGMGVARGYIHQPELNKKHFSCHPYHQEIRMYRTGDIGRWLEDGNIEFLGRMDKQIKLRGYRIEPDEIEHAIKQIQGIKDAVVCPIVEEHEEANNMELVAFVTGDSTLYPNGIKKHLKNDLPEYMIPSHIVMLDVLPLTPNRKIDKKQLISSWQTRNHKIHDVVLPKDELEQQLLTIWESVLSMNQLSMHDNFFDLGGHSIKATRLISRIQTQLGIEIGLKEIYTYSTLAELADFIRSKTQDHQIAIGHYPEQDHYPLTYSQRRIWFLCQMGASLSYSMPACIDIRGDLDIHAFKSAFETLSARHESLRTTFCEIEGEPRQVIHAAMPIHFTVVDVSDDDSPEHCVNQNIQNEIAKPFDLEHGPLFRVYIFILKKQQTHRHILLVNFHHIIADGWSMGILNRELTHSYNALVSFTPLALPTPNLQYRDIALWQQTPEVQEIILSQKAYWKSKLQGELPICDLPSDFPRKHIQTFNGSYVEQLIDPDITTQLRLFCKARQVTLFTFMVAIVKVLIMRYTGQDDVIIGTPVSGRYHPDVENCVGCLINMLALRDQVNSDTFFHTYLEHIKNTVSEAYDHQLYPFDVLVNELNLRRDLSRSPIFDVVVSLQHESETSLLLHNLITQSYPTQWLTTPTQKYDIVVNVVEYEKQIQIRLEYNSDLFLKERIERMLNHLNTLMQSVLDKPNNLIGELEILTQHELHHLVHELNNTHFEITNRQSTIENLKIYSIVDWFEAIVAQYPNQIAVVFNDVQLTYAELNAKANTLADYLIQTYSISTEEPIGLLMERSDLLIVGMMGILKANAAFVPIDPITGTDRLQLMVNQNQLRVIITQDMLVQLFQNHQHTYSDQNPKIRPGVQNLCYVIFTSGSTGQPKGIMVEHASLMNLIFDYFCIQPSDRVSLTCRHTFDVSVLEIFSALVSGATLFIPEIQVVIDPETYARFLCEHQISLTYIHPMHLEIIQQSLKSYPKQYLSKLLIGVEPIHFSTITWFLEQGCQVINGYGPTETTVCATFYRVMDEIKAQRQPEVIPIGRPVANNTIYILDKNKKPVPIGVRGEICISGIGLARGYLHQPMVTQKAFIQNPFDLEKRLYLTGDIGYFQSDGNIMFCGRRDNQVKLHGYRIELEEIVYHLLAYPQVKNAIVVFSEGLAKSKELIAYIISKDHERISMDLLRHFLESRLPRYMIPAYIIAIDEFPTTSHGKIDRKALPLPTTDRPQLTSQFIEPMSSLEKKIADIWKSQLQIDQIGIHDAFFDLGGNSLLMVPIKNQINEQISKDVSLIDLFKYPTIYSLAHFIQSKNQENKETEEQRVEIIPAEKRLKHQAVVHQKRMSRIQHRIIKE
ncbi:MAG: amino acid adenylation domain-containing protein [Desulfobacterales bacterium]|nr:amino acid adenylation domain-containing protein [Desulfobacterales bacterium]